MKNNRSLLAMLAILLIAWNLQAQNANTALSNLTNTSVNKSLVPKTTNASDLGSTTKLWRKAYFSGDALINGLTVGLGAGAIISNTAIGNGALNFNSSGIGNVANGYQALFSNTKGFNNTANGAYALYSNTTGNDNTANGNEALYYNTTGYGNTANGSSALLSNTEGLDNTANGDLTLLNNTTGSYNVANGVSALLSNTDGAYNTANGFQALSLNTIGTGNSAHGYQTLYSNTNGIFNTANGFQALYSGGSYNSANGIQALYYNTSTDNTADGAFALFYNTTGYGNTASGSYALNENTTGINLTGMGNLADVNSDGYSNSSAFGYNTLITASDQVRIGNSDVTSIGGYARWTNISDKRVKKNIEENVPGLEFINLLKPVTYNYDLDAADKIVWPNGKPQYKDANGKPVNLPDDRAQRSAKEQIRYSGFLAQDVESAAKKIGYDFSGVDAPKNDKDLYGLRYEDFIMPLVKAVQELDVNQKMEVKSQNEEIASLKAEIADLKLQISNLQALNNGGSLGLPGSSTGGIEGALLDQNIPNPFDHSTTIAFRLPRNYSAASVVITETSSGQTVKTIPITEKDTSIRIDASIFTSGSYSYSLVIDGKVIDTKTMIISK